MSDTLLSLRQELKAIAEEATGFKTFTYFPDAFMPPAIFVVPSSPYLTTGETFGSHSVSFRLWVMSSNGTNETVTDFIDETLHKLIPALQESQWLIEQVEGSFQEETDANILSTVLRVTTGMKF